MTRLYDTTRDRRVAPSGAADGRARKAFDARAVRREFPALEQMVNGHPLVYLDNAATTQKPRAVIDAVAAYYSSDNANIHRAPHTLAQRATAAYENARRTVQRFVNAADEREIIFTRGATESINLVAATFGRANLRPGDEIVITGMEHHSNIVPWQMLCEQTGAVLKVVPFNDEGEVLLEEYRRTLSPRTRLVSIVHVSNSLGTVNPVAEMVRMAHERGAVVLVDGAQWVAHAPTDVRALDCDFYAFSGHKLYGPTGIGVLYGRLQLLETMPPYQGGGDMIESVTFEKTTYNQPPHRFEAGTPHIAGAVGLAAAIDFLSQFDFEDIRRHESELLALATERLCAIPGLRIVGRARQKAGVISFLMTDPPMSPLDLAVALDALGIAVRAGHHCCQPVMDRYRISGTTRMSLAMYNTVDDIEALAEAVAGIRRAAAARAVAVPSGAGAALRFPEPAADSPQSAADELAETFDMLGDRDARNQYILELGDSIPPMPDELKTEENRVHGCMSNVFLVGRRRPGSEDRLDFIADSDAHIVRGLIGMLQKLFAGQRCADILAFDIEGFFRRIGLDQFVSTQRRNGLAGMVGRIRSLAAAIGSRQEERR